MAALGPGEELVSERTQRLMALGREEKLEDEDRDGAVPVFPDAGDIEDEVCEGDDWSEEDDIDDDEYRRRRREALREYLAARPGGETNRYARDRILMDRVEIVRLEWLWPGRIPLGKLTMLEGHPESGKSTLTVDLAARVSRGRAMPGCEGMEPRQPGGVVILSAEDDLGDTVKPRLLAAGADIQCIISRQNSRDERGTLVPVTIEHLAELREDIVSVNAKLVIIDPLVAFMPADTNTNSDHQVRQALAGLVALSADLCVAIVVIRHFRKGPTGNPMHAGGGSIAFTGLTRAVLQAGRDPDDPAGERFVLALAKKNLSRGAASLAYRIVSAGEVGKIEWLGESRQTAESLLEERAGQGRRAMGEVVALLESALAAGPVAATSIMELAKEEGLSDKLVRKVAKEIGVTFQREGFGPGSTVHWELPGG